MTASPLSSVTVDSEMTSILPDLMTWPVAIILLVFAGLTKFILNSTAKTSESSGMVVNAA
jgi:hypothetical protein